MKEMGLERRLAAILAADVAGYTTLMGADEAGKSISPADRCDHDRNQVDRQQG